MSEPSKWSAFYFKKGSKQGMDEPTDAYSDDEGSQDSYTKRKDAKTATQVIHARSQTLRSRIKANSNSLSGAQPSQEAAVDLVTDKHRPRVAIRLNNVSTVTDTTVTAARNIDRETRTQMYQTTVNERGEHGLDQNVHRVFVSFDPVALLEQWHDSRFYWRNLVLGLAGLLIAFYLYYHVYSQTRGYLQ
jgi:hypothetical protein